MLPEAPPPPPPVFAAALPPCSGPLDAGDPGVAPFTGASLAG